MSNFRMRVTTNYKGTPFIKNHNYNTNSIPDPVLDNWIENGIARALDFVPSKLVPLETKVPLNSKVDKYESLVSGSEFDLLTIRPQNYLFVSNSFVTDQGINQFKTVNEALSIFEDGNVIYLFPETFNEEIIINKSGVILIGGNQENTILENITITKKNVKISNLTIGETLNVICTDTQIDQNTIKFSNVIFLCDISIGTALIQTTYKCAFYNCYLNPTDKTFIVNTSTEIYVEGCESAHHIWTGPSTLPKTYHIILYQGVILFRNCPYIFLSTIEFTDDSNTFAQLYVNNGSLDYVIMTIPDTASKQNNFTFERGRLNNWGKSSALTIQGKMEFNLFYCHLEMGNGNNFVFNSTSKCRIIGVTQTVYNSNATISGTGLANLHIFNSIFHGASPGGLGTDSNNAWSAFIDY